MSDKPLVQEELAEAIGSMVTRDRFYKTLILGRNFFWINFHQPPTTSHPKAFIYMIIMDITKSWSQSYDF
jgi:hypothetical protein